MFRFTVILNTDLGKMASKLNPMEVFYGFQGFQPRWVSVGTKSPRRNNRESTSAELRKNEDSHCALPHTVQNLKFLDGEPGTILAKF